MKHANLTFITSTLLAMMALGFTAQSVQAQTETGCRSTYEQMLRNSQTRPDIAAIFGKNFLNQGCGTLFPSVVEPIKKYIVAAENGGGAAATQQEKSIGERYGSREPRTCENTKAPTQGAITAELAKKYFICAAEKQEGRYLYLVENVKVEVGGGIPYAAIIGHRSFPEIDVKHPVYPIRGSHAQYQCQAENAQFDFTAPGRNCHRYEHQKATGYCYKTTFGDWRCYQTDLNIPNENIFNNAPPPKGKKNAVGNKKLNNSVNETPNLQQGKFPKPDLSALDQWYEVSNVELDVFARRLTFIAKAKRKEGRPTNFWVQFLDKDGVVIFEDTPLALRAWFGSETPTEPKRITVGTPSEGSMSAVKTIKIVRKPDY